VGEQDVLANSHIEQDRMAKREILWHRTDLSGMGVRASVAVVSRPDEACE
jgi:hypothetical protein